MPTVKYNFPIELSDLPLSSAELAGRYFFGIKLVDQEGNIIPNEALQFYIQSAVEQIEGYLNLKLTKQVIKENLHYSLSDFQNWGYIPLSYPALSVHRLEGFASGVRQVEYPTEWLSIKQSTSNSDTHRSVYLVPGTGRVSVSGGSVYAGILPHLGWKGANTIPNYWEITYCTSFNSVPSDILDIIGKLASINVFHQLGDIILGAGIANQSISIDGLSQSIGTTSSATNAGYGARITGYLADLKKSLPMLKAKYDGNIIMSM